MSALSLDRPRGGVRLSILRQLGQEACDFAAIGPSASSSIRLHRVRVSGEEVLLVDGMFVDKQGRDPAGSWVRRPQPSQHQPFSREGSIILVRTGHLVAAADPVP